MNSIVLGSEGLVLDVGGVSVKQDRNGRFCLNDLHRASGGEKRHGPSYWMANQQTRDLIAEIQTTGISAVATYEGASGGTYVVKELVYAYAMWVSPTFHLKVIRAYDQRHAPRPAELSRMDILKLAMESEQARIEAEQKLALAAPKAEFVDRYVQAESGSMGVRQVCKLLAAKQNEFTDWLMARGFMYRQMPGSPLTPKAEHIHNGRFEAKTGVAEHDESSHAYVHYKFTAKGVEWIAGEWAKFKIKTAQVAQ